MRLVGHLDELDLPAVGLEDGDQVLPLAQLVTEAGLRPELGLLDLVGLLAEDDGLAETREAFERARAAGLVGLPRATIRRLAPLQPGKIVCIGQNYRGHVTEQGLALPERPMLFAKFANAVVGDGAPIVRPAATRALDLEVELAVVVGRRLSRVAAADALAHLAGYLAANDVSARDLQGVRAALAEGQRGDGQWLRAKGSDTFLPLGPCLVTPDELAETADPADLRLRSWRTPAAGSGAGVPQPMQDGRTSDMVFGLPALLEFISAGITLEPGDVVVTGTPSGVGVFRDPPVYLEPGDVVRVEVEGIGRLTNPIVDADGTAPAGSPAALALAGAAAASAPAPHSRR